MRVCVFYDEYYAFDEFLNQYPCEWELQILRRPVRDKIKELADSGRYDIFFNLCDCPLEGLSPGIDVVQTLEEFNLAFTGADSHCYDPTREEMQTVAFSHQIGFAKGTRVYAGEDVLLKANDLQYPIMVKHPKSYGSTGMTKDSRADALEHVHTQVERICAEYGAARMEEFIVGKEFNVLVVDNADDLSQPIAYPPAELVFPPNEEFWHVDVKWNYDAPFDFKQVTDPQLIARLHDLAKRMYLAIGLSGYGRCDIRMNNKGELFILEINPNGGIMFKPEEYGPADYMILYDADGYKGFFDCIFRAAHVRQKLRAAK